MVPKGYLRSLLNKEDEKLLDKNHLFQTKDLDNVMDRYKIYRQYLYQLRRSHDLGGPLDEWVKVKKNVTIRFCDYLQDKKGDEYELACEFTFKNGKVDKKELIQFRLQTSKEEREAIDKMWDTDQKILDAYRTTSIKYKFYARLERRFQKMTNWARKKHSIPLKVRTEAYEKSGRLAKDPECLKLYEDS